MGLGGKEGFVYVDLGVDVDRVISNVEELDDFGLGKLLVRAFAALRVRLLAGGLHKQNN